MHSFYFILILMPDLIILMTNKRIIVVIVWKKYGNILQLNYFIHKQLFGMIRSNKKFVLLAWFTITNYWFVLSNPFYLLLQTKTISIKLTKANPCLFKQQWNTLLMLNWLKMQYNSRCLKQTEDCLRKVCKWNPV